MAEPRLRVLLVTAALVATPAAVLQWRCGAGGCEPPPQPTRVPFCAAPRRRPRPHRGGVPVGPLARGRGDDGTGRGRADGNDAVAHGRSPGRSGPAGVHRRRGVEAGTLPPGVTLDDVAPTLAAAAGFRRPFPRVRSGAAVDARADPGPDARLLVGRRVEGRGGHGTSPERVSATALFDRGCLDPRGGDPDRSRSTDRGAHHHRDRWAAVPARGDGHAGAGTGRRRPSLRVPAPPRP